MLIRGITCKSADMTEGKNEEWMIREQGFSSQSSGRGHITKITVSANPPIVRQ